MDFLDELVLSATLCPIQPKFAGLFIKAQTRIMLLIIEYLLTVIFHECNSALWALTNDRFIQFLFPTINFIFFDGRLKSESVELTDLVLFSLGHFSLTLHN
jgi:hypothetical protein